MEIFLDFLKYPQTHCMRIPLINFDQNLSFTKNLAIIFSLTLRRLPHTTWHLALALTKIDQFYPIMPCHAPCLTPYHALFLTFSCLSPCIKLNHDNKVNRWSFKYIVDEPILSIYCLRKKNIQCPSNHMIRSTNYIFGFFGNFKIRIRICIRVFQNIRFGFGFVFDCFKIQDSDSDSYSITWYFKIRIQIRIR